MPSPSDRRPARAATAPANLADQQGAFAALLLDTAGGDHTALVVDDTQALTTLFRGPASRSRRGLAAYRNNVLGNWRHALAATYPVCARVLGGARFALASDRYAADGRSHSGDLNAYGEDFADFLASWPAVQELPYLPDLARLEWDVQTAYYAADAAPFDVAALAAALAPASDGDGSPAIAPECWRFPLAPACRLRVSPFPLAAIWQAHDAHPDDAAVPPVPFTSGPHHALVCRSHGRVTVRPISAGEAAFLDALAVDQPLPAAIAAGLASAADFDAPATLCAMVTTGVLSSPRRLPV